MVRFAVALVLVLSPTAFAQSFPEHSVGYAKVAKPARVSLTPDGPWLATPVAPDVSLTVYDDRPARPRFGESFITGRILFYVDRDALTLAITKRTLVLPTKDATTGADIYRSVGFVAAPGTPIEKLGDQNGVTNVRIKSGDSEIIGFVPSTATGTTYRFDYATRPTFLPTQSLPATFALLDKPKGVEFVRVSGSTRQPIAVIQRKAGFALVQLENGPVGWIATKNLGKRVNTGGDTTGGEEGGMVSGVVGGSLDPETLPDKTPLFDGIDGAFVGIAESFNTKPVERKGPWTRFALETPYGTISVWASSNKGPEKPPQNIPPTLLEGSRIAGDKNIVPDDATKLRIIEAKKTRVVGSWKLCIDRAGAISTLQELKSTGFRDYDLRLEAGMSEWKYKPYLVDGTPTPVCTAITFIYALH